MDHSLTVGSPEFVDAARRVLLEDFARLVHDLECECEDAQKEAALAALLLADWSVAEATRAWLVARSYA